MTQRLAATSRAQDKPRPHPAHVELNYRPDADPVRRVEAPLGGEPVLAADLDLAIAAGRGLGFPVPGHPGRRAVVVRSVRVRR